MNYLITEKGVIVVPSIKKLFSVLLILLLLCACSAQASADNSQSESDISSAAEALPDGFVTVESGTDVLFVKAYSEGTRQGLVADKNGICSLNDITNTKVLLLSKNGELLSEEPFDAFDYFVDDSEWWVVGIRDGVLYPFYVNTENGAVTPDEPKGVEPEEFFGYTVYRHYWNKSTPYYGITAPDGSSFAEPVYHKVLVPFSDRILLFNGNDQIADRSTCTIVNSENEVLSDCFNYADFTVFDDGSYIGIAMCGKDSGDGKLQRYDSNGDPMPEGFWFIDRDGNIISECFAGFEGDWMPVITSPEDVITAIRPDGSTAQFSASEYLLFD